MKDTPTSGPIPNITAPQANDAMSSRHSLSTSHKNAALGECKENLFKISVCSRQISCRCQRRKFFNRSFATHAPTAKQNEAVAKARGIADLMNREEQRPPAGRVLAEHRRDVACLTQVKAVEGLVDEQRWLRRQ